MVKKSDFESGNTNVDKAALREFNRRLNDLGIDGATRKFL